MTDRLIPVTDDRGRVLAGFDIHDYEPYPGSVVLTQGEFGTAWQRFFSDGKWHSTRGGTPKQWTEMLAQRNLVLVYDAPLREQRGDQR